MHQPKFAAWYLHATGRPSRSTLGGRAVWFRLGIVFTFAICYRPSVCRLSVVCNVRAPDSGVSNFRQFFYGVGHLGHPLTCTEPSAGGGELNPRAVAKYSDFGPVEGYISETVQDRR